MMSGIITQHVPYLENIGRGARGCLPRLELRDIDGPRHLLSVRVALPS